MKYGNIEILDIDFEYKLWKNKIIFYRTEIELLLDRVNVLIREKPSWELEESSKLMLDIQLSTLSATEKQIKTQEQEMAFYAEDYPVSNTHSHYVIHEKIRRDIEKITNRHFEIMSDIYPVLCYPLSLTENSLL